MALEARLEMLEKKHIALEEELHSALNQPSTDDTEITEIKRRKLKVKDEIQRLRSETA
jgi:hypothetical protein